MHVNSFVKKYIFKEQNDEYWIKRLPNDVTAYNIIYDRYLIPVYRYVFRRVSNKWDAEDITAIVFLTVLERLLAGKYTSNGQFAAWLFTIARSKIADYYRQPVDFSLDVAEIINENKTLFTDNETDELKDLTRCFGMLSPYEQDLLAFRYSALLDFRTISIILNKSQSSVKMATYRSIQKLRNRLKGEIDGTDNKEYH